MDYHPFNYLNSLENIISQYIICNVSDDVGLIPFTKSNNIVSAVNQKDTQAWIYALNSMFKFLS